LLYILIPNLSTQLMPPITATTRSLCGKVQSYLSRSTAKPLSIDAGTAHASSAQTRSTMPSSSQRDSRKEHHSNTSSPHMSLATSIRSTVRSIWDETTKAVDAIPFTEVLAWSVVPAASLFLAYTDGNSRICKETRDIPSAITRGGPLDAGAWSGRYR
jgi:hypothetical protein